MRLCSTMSKYLRHEDEERVLVGLPEVTQLFLGRELVAADLHGKLEAVGVQVVPVLHAACHRR